MADFKRIPVYLSEDEQREIRIAAAIVGKSMSEFCKDAALEAARRTSRPHAGASETTSAAERSESEE